MDIRFEEVSIVDGHPNVVFIIASATDGVNTVKESFTIGREPTGRRIVQDRQGRLRTADGRWIDPATLDLTQPEPAWEYETFTVDLRAEYLAVIVPVLRRALDPGDPKVASVATRTRRSRTDPLAILTRADISSLDGATLDETALAVW